jgi:two-component sensor histidine kinase
MVLSAIVDISDRKQKEMRIQAALREKDVLLGEIHHRVKNNLQIIDSLLDLQSSRIEDESIRSVLRDSQNRIRSMALIHQTLYQSKDFARVDLAGVLESLIPNLVASYGLIPERIELQLDVEEVFLSINQAIPCGLIVNELITNALKHAFPESKGQIEVELALDKDTVALTIGDNGAGVPAHVEWGKTGTLGLQLVQLLAEQLGGSITMQRSPTRFELRFPLAV